MSKKFTLATLKKIWQKGILFYVKLSINKIQRRSKFFGFLFKKFKRFYRIKDVKIDTGSDLFPLELYSRFFFKIYEQEEIALIEKYLQGNNNVLELGACIGVVSCVTNKHINHPGNHVVVEANPELIEYLKKIRQLTILISSLSMGLLVIKGE